MQAQQFRYAQDTFVPPYSQNVAYRRPVFQQPYGRPLGPVWSNMEAPAFENFQNNSVSEPAQHHPHYNVNLNQSIPDSLPQFMDPNRDKKRIPSKNENSFFTKVIELFQQQSFSSFHQGWIKEELNFTMNKISVAGLFFGLMFLGSLFFLIGFLVAVNLYGHKTVSSILTEQRSVMPSQGATLSGRTNQMMDATAYPAGMMVQPAPNNGSLSNNGRMPSSMQKQSIMSSSFQKQQRMPSFQVSGNQ